MSKKDQRELYRSAFSRLHASDTLDWEEMNMKNKKQGFRCRRSLVVFAAVLIVLMAMSALTYAATDGQVLETVKVWINGSSVDASSYTQEDGSIQIDLSEGDTVEVEGEDWTVLGNGEGAEETVKINKDGEVEVDINDINEASGESQE